MKKIDYKIGELAKKAKVKVETLRFYEAQGLLVAPKRSASGYRLYESSAVQTMTFIAHAKQVGFSLKEIKFLLDFQLNKNQHTCEEVKVFTGNKIFEISAKINQLQTMKNTLEELHTACCGGLESAQKCSILKALKETY